MEDLFAADSGFVRRELSPVLERYMEIRCEGNYVRVMNVVNKIFHTMGIELRMAYDLVSSSLNSMCEIGKTMEQREAISEEIIKYVENVYEAWRQWYITTKKEENENV